MTPELAGLPILCRPKEGAVESTFNEQSRTLSLSISLSLSLGTPGCLVDRASVELIM